MRKIIADALPMVKIISTVNPYDDTPAIKRLDVEMSANDMDLESMGFEEVWDETFARVSLVMFDPKKGNPTDAADADSQGLLNVSSAFYDPDGDLSLRMLERAHNVGGSIPPLVYIESIEMLEGYEKSGALEAGLAQALARIASDWGCEQEGVSLMLAAFEQETMRMTAKLGDSKNAKQVQLPKSLIEALELEVWVKKDQPFAAEMGHGAEQGLVLPQAAREMMGFGDLAGQEMLGSAGFDEGFELKDRERSDKQIQARGEKLMAIRALSEKKKIADKIGVRRAAKKEVPNDQSADPLKRAPKK